MNMGGLCPGFLLCFFVCKLGWSATSTYQNSHTSCLWLMPVRLLSASGSDGLVVKYFEYYSECQATETNSNQFKQRGIHWEEPRSHRIFWRLKNLAGGRVIPRPIWNAMRQETAAWLGLDAGQEWTPTGIGLFGSLIMTKIQKGSIWLLQAFVNWTQFE